MSKIIDRHNYLECPLCQELDKVHIKEIFGSFGINGYLNLSARVHLPEPFPGLFDKKTLDEFEVANKEFWEEWDLLQPLAEKERKDSHKT